MAKTITFKEETWPVARLAPCDKNPRQHPPEQVDLLARSILEHGIYKPVLVDQKGTILIGTGVWLGAQKAGVGHVPVRVVRGWSTAQKRAVRILDNQVALKSNWDLDLLSSELQDLKLEGIDLGSLGFELDDLSALFAPPGAEGLTDPDALPELEKRAISRPGDVWELGAHRVACGDSTNPGAVERLLAGGRPSLMVSDPPYSVDYDPNWRAQVAGRVKRPKGKVLNDDRADWREAWAPFPGSVAYVWHSALHASEVAESLSATGFGIRSEIIWVKDHFALSRGDYHWQHEPCFYAVRKGGESHWAGDRKQSTIWHIPNLSGYRSGRREQSWGHGTQKPVECMRRPIINNSRPGSGVYDPFLGSGTTLIAAEMTGRACFGLELSPAYVDMTIRRWQAFTGREARLEKDQKTFEECASDRKPGGGAGA